ncbi:hypothetical protein ANACAC_03100 [Anaerostipes caccae L1-92]|uniref:Uncharacterized protein n=1 Tax=Anaerostipes caccae (strain DSM 14662 / CCUG 47493 / JCM 13470 / NCIMB 13811 / L1-92) TaxID=411490 RepID=B0MHY8_ANACD|nr:hypothetical protein ANACAC_03100 [Anaerostipes caccae L1-92]
MQPQMILDLSPDEILKRIKSAVLCTMFHRSELYRVYSPSRLV